MQYTMLVHGHSDDIIEVEGDVTEELYIYNTPKHIFVGNTELVVEYGGVGEWFIDVVEEGINDTIEKFEIGDKYAVEHGNDYSELIKIHSNNNRVEEIKE